jgi:Tol biopolymer transport system component/DNA-binding winged helix-turn-helix (wHTH) protein
MASPEKPEGPVLIRFGDFTLDLRRRGLFRTGQRVHLTPKPLETLIVLVENRGRTVEKSRLLEEVWKDTAVSDGTLVQAVREIRRALEDDKEDPAFVQTVPREGYRFMGEVTLDSPAEARTRTLSRSAIALIALAIVVAAVSLTVALSRRGANRASAPAAGGAQLRQLSTGLVSAVKPSFSRDGKVLLFASDAGDFPGTLDLYVMPAEGGNAWRITDRANASGDLPVFTTDGTSVVFSRFRSGEGGDRRPDLWIVPSFGGAPALFMPEASGAGFSPDGKDVAYTRHLRGRRPLWTGRVAEREGHRELSESGFSPRFSPDGRWIAYTTSDPEGGAGQLFLASSTGSERIQLTDRPEQMYGLAWTPDGRSLLYAVQREGSFHLLRVPASGGPSVAVTAGLGEYTAPTVSPDGRTLVFCHSRPLRDLVLADDVGSASPRNLTEEENHSWPRLSPSGRRLASVSRQFDYDGRLYVFDLPGGSRLRGSTRPALFPCWVDEERLAYLSRPTGSAATELRLLELSTRADRTWTRFEDHAEWLAVHPDGARVAVVITGPDGRRRIVLRQVATGTDTVLAEGAEYEGLRFSPDGSALAWSGPRLSADAASNGIWVVELGRDAPRRVVKDGFAPAWDPAGGALYLSRFLGPDAGLWRFDLAAGTETRVRTWSRVPYFDVAGGRLAFAPERGRSQIYAMSLGE